MFRSDTDNLLLLTGSKHPIYSCAVVTIQRINRSSTVELVLSPDVEQRNHYYSRDRSVVIVSGVCRRRSADMYSTLQSYRYTTSWNSGFCSEIITSFTMVRKVKTDRTDFRA